MPLNPSLKATVQTHWKCWVFLAPATLATGLLIGAKGCNWPTPPPTPTPGPNPPPAALAISTIVGGGKPVSGPGPVSAPVGVPIKHTASGAGVTGIVWHVDASPGGDSAGYGVYPDLTGDNDLLAVPTSKGTYTVRAIGVKAGVPAPVTAFVTVVVGDPGPGPGPPIPIPKPVPPTITSAASASGTVNAAFNFQLAATGDAPISWAIDSVANVPPGLNLSAATGLLAGTPSKAGTFTLNVEATNAAGKGSQSLTITIKDAPNPPPIPAAGLRVLFVYESNKLSTYPKEAVAVLYSKQVKDFLRANTVLGPDSRTREWRMYDKDTNVSKESKLWQDAMARPRASYPWLVISNGTAGFEGPVTNVADTMALLNKFKGP